MDPASKAKAKSPPSKSTSPGKQKTRKKHKKQRPIHPAPAATISAAEALQPIFTPADIARLSAADFGAFLIGESFMRQADPAQALHALVPY